MSFDAFDRMWADLAPLGRDAIADTGSAQFGGYRRLACTDAERACRDWFLAEARRRDLDVREDGNRNLWAWRGDPDRDGPGVVTGSHLDSVPDGGAYDGPLGVVSAFAALDLLEQGAPSDPFAPSDPSNTTGADDPPRTHRETKTPIGIVAFADEEGGRFGLPCAGSRLLTGAVDPADVRARTDADGMSYEQALLDAGHDPERLGAEPATLARIGALVELHVEQGRGLADLGAPVALGERIWPHGRWRFEFTGRADHAGTTRMEDRADPMLTYAMTALAANKRARLAERSGARATFGKVAVRPNGTNAVPSAVTAWLDARAADEEALDELVAAIRRQAEERAERDGTALAVTAESRTPASVFDPALQARLAEALTGGQPPVLPTAAGHDAGILADSGIPTAMLFVRNPTGTSHAPDEYAAPADCHAGVDALATALRELATSPLPAPASDAGRPGEGPT